MAQNATGSGVREARKRPWGRVGWAYRSPAERKDGRHPLRRYDFEGGGKIASDRVGSAHGTVEGFASQTELNDKGVLALLGNGSYVNLPNFLISKLANVSIETWVSWNGGKPWQRIFDFGGSNAASPEDNPLDGKDYLFLSASTPADRGGGSRFGFSLTGSGGESPFTDPLSSINDVNVWLGRSQYVNDPAFSGTFYEFRIYDDALTAQQIAISYVGGPDPVFLAE